MAQTLAMVSRILSSPSRVSGPKRINSPKKRQQSASAASGLRHGSELLAALDALVLRDEEEEESDTDIEVIGPFPAQNVEMQSENSGQNASRTQPTKMIHPFFLGLTQSAVASRAADSDLHGKRAQTSAAKIGHAPERSSQVTYSRTMEPSARSTGKARSNKSSRTTKSNAKMASVLPIYSYKDYDNPKPTLVFTKHEDETNDLVESLKPGPVAMDLEWRVMYSKVSGSHAAQLLDRRVAVVQIADTNGLILVAQVYGMARFPSKLMALIEDPNVPKLGVNILNDGRKLFSDYGIMAKNLLELGALAIVADLHAIRTRRKIVSLARLVERYCGKILTKGAERTGNWEGTLNKKQIEYAANDAHSSVMVYNAILDTAESIGVDVGAHKATYTSDVEFPNNSPAAPTPLPATSSENSGTALVGDAGLPEKPEGSTLPDQMETTRVFAISSSHSQPNLPQMRFQYMRAYHFWHEKCMSMEKMQIELSLKGKVAEGNLGDALKAGTVISYVVGALQADPTLPFDKAHLKELVQMDSPSWIRHREWLLQVLK